MRLSSGIRVKLTLALVGIVGGALLAAYTIVVPSLERNLVDAKLEQLEANANTVTRGLAGSDVLSSPIRLDSAVRQLADHGLGDTKRRPIVGQAGACRHLVMRPGHAQAPLGFCLVVRFSMRFSGFAFNTSRCT